MQQHASTARPTDTATPGAARNSSSNHHATNQQRNALHYKHLGQTAAPANRQPAARSHSQSAKWGFCKAAAVIASTGLGSFIIGLRVRFNRRIRGCQKLKRFVDQAVQRQYTRGT